MPRLREGFPLIINSSLKAFELFNKRISSAQEELWLLTLNSDLRAIGVEMIFRGTATHCTFHARDLIREICIKNATSFIIAHNHPSGNLKPSKQDKLVTKKINNISKILEISFQDHLILTNKGYFSFKDHMLLI
jgi:DNA repair protein RadC